jgi:TRAP-type C4-dicarboxylate transport system permease small subunit
MTLATAGGWFRRLSSGCAWLLEQLLVISVAVLIVPVSLQIFSRYTAVIPHYIWTEELARFVFIWMVMLGAMLGIKEGSHFTVDVWPRLGPKATAALDILGGVMVLVMAVVFVWWGWEFTRFAFRRISELAELPLWWIHVAWPLTGVTWLLFQGERLWRDVRVIQGRDTLPEHELGAGAL